MTLTTRPGSILLGTTDPDRLRAFYETVLGGTSDGGAVVFGDFCLVIDQRDDVAPGPVEPGRFILNFHVSDFGAVEAALRSHNVTWIAEPEDRPFGRFGTFADPDGNYLQIVTLNSDDHTAA